jgi:GR25 family glycosyltransferase involved in LPS biosynthesis
MRPNNPTDNPTDNLNSLRDIKHCFYINLNSRTDRKKHVESELHKIGIQAQRFEAIRLTNGALGCSMSHLKCLETAKNNNWDHVLIVEDDITFLNPNLFQEQVNKCLSKFKDFDVLLIAGNNIPPYKIMDDCCVQVTKCQTTTGYLVKSHYYEKLIANIKLGINMLIREPAKHVLYAIDKYWFNLQEKDTWYLVTPLTVTQKDGYSDIEKKITNYTRVMTELDKPWLLKKENNTNQTLSQKPNNVLHWNKPSTTLNNVFL